MEPRDRERIAEAWIAIQRSWWAYDRLGETIESSPADAWDLIRELIARADSEDLIVDVGAGPLEDFVRAHGATYIDSIEELAATSPPFAAALQAVIYLPDSPVAARLAALGCHPVGPACPK